MNALQEKPPVVTPPSATRPFTRVPNVICDEIKPGMVKHKVDRCVLDAIIRQLEGFHRSWVVITIGELAARAGVSQSSVSAALARLETAGLITRWRKLLKDRSRFVWGLALTEKYRVVEGIGPAPSGPTKFHQPCPAPTEPVPSASSPPGDIPPSKARDDEPDLAVSIEPPLETVPSEEPVPADPPPLPATSSLGPSNPERQAAAQIPADKPARPDLTAEQLVALEALRAVNIDYWMARKLARAHSPALIHQVLQDLRHHAGTVRNPAAWLVRAIERGGYASPHAAEEEKLKNERAAREALQREREAREAAHAERACEALLTRYRQLDPKRQRELEQLARTELARVSPRLAEAPVNVETPGPFRSKLLELLELSPDLASLQSHASSPTAASLPGVRLAPLDPASGILLARFRQLDPERQRELEQRTRAELRRVSSRLAEAPWDLATPGPVRSQLLQLLEMLPGFDKEANLT